MFERNDFSKLRLVPASDSDREFSYRVKKEAEGIYITAQFGWDEKLQREFHSRAWLENRPDIISYREESIGTIAISQGENEITIAQFFILPRYQRKGIGTYLLQSILHRADKYQLVTRLTHLRNNPVKTLYERNGFQVVKQDEIFFHLERKPNIKKKKTDRRT